MNKGLKLITETISPKNLKYSVLNEEDQFGETQKNYYIYGPFIVSEERNQNGRIYKENVIEREVNKFMSEKVKHNRAGAGGELNHPDSPIVNLERISHYIRDLQQEGNVWLGKAQIANTPMGAIAKALLKDGYSLGVSTRGLGQVADDGEVGEDYNLITVDLVSEPSAHDAYMQSIFENKEFIIQESGLIVEKPLEEMKKAVEVMSVKKEIREEQVVAAINDFINTLKGGN